VEDITEEYLVQSWCYWLNTAKDDLRIECDYYCPTKDVYIIV